MAPDAAPLDALDAIALQEVRVGDGLRHLELYTMRGLLTVLWHGDEDAEDVVLAFGGAMGGVLGPANGIYHDLGERLWAEHGIATMRIGYRRPNDVDRCTHDVLAAADLAGRKGAQRFVTMGHSFGGAVAVRAGIALHRHVAGVVTLSTQSAGCEQAELLGETPLLLVHGERDELLPPFVSETVRMIAGHGELVLLPDDGHLLDRSPDQLRQLLARWIPEQFAACASAA